MGCSMSAPGVDGDEALPRTIKPSAAKPPRPSLLKSHMHDVNRRSDALQEGSQLVAKDKDRYPSSPLQGMGPALSKRNGDMDDSLGSPSFRCYVKNEMQTDGTDIVSAICEERRASRKRCGSPLRNENTENLPSNQEAELSSHKKEKGWMSKVLIKRSGSSNSGNATLHKA